MTVFEATATLYAWFSENDSFNLKEDFISIVPLTETPDRDKAAIMCGLEKWKDMNMLEHHNDYWILSKKMSSLEQNVTISADVAAVLATFANRYAEVIKDNTYECDPFDIKEKDIQAILGLCGDLIKS